MVPIVKLRRPGDTPKGTPNVLMVNPLAVAAVEADNERPKRCNVFVGNASIRVVGEINEILAQLGWVELHDEPNTLTAEPPASPDGKDMVPADDGLADIMT